MRLKLYSKIPSMPNSTQVISATTHSKTPPGALQHMASKPMTSLGTRIKNKPIRMEDSLAEIRTLGINEFLPILTIC